MFVASWVLLRKISDFKPEEFWSGRVTIEVEPQAWFLAAAAAGAARTDAGVAHACCVFVPHLKSTG